ncbi:MAG: hypothetical protein KBC43_05110 [Bacteroidales bacterium]|nr:hypothetical protein [Bacteroidales bacterium]
MKRHLHILLLLLLPAPLLVAQQENRFIRQGNKQYDDEKFKEAEVSYIKSTQAKNASHKGFYNLGNAWYMQENYLQASAAFDTLRTFRMDDDTRAKSYYNLGNAMLKSAQDSAQLAGKFLPASVEAYKQSLRLNPEDEEAKYNLAYAQKLMQQQQQQQQQQNQDQKDQQKEQQKDQQKQQDQKDQQQDQQQQDQQNAEQANQDQQQANAEPQQISKEDAERILEALKNDEKETLEKLSEAKIQSVRVVKTDKDW